MAKAKPQLVAKSTPADKVMINDMEVDAYLYACVSIDKLNIKDEFVRISSDFAYWNERYTQAHEADLLATIDKDKVRAQMRIEHRERLLMRNEKVTESMVDSAVETDQVVLNSRVACVQTEVEKTRLRGLLEAIRAKRDMLISTGSMIRQEMSTDPTLRRQMADRDSLDFQSR